MRIYERFQENTNDVMMGNRKPDMKTFDADFLFNNDDFDITNFLNTFWDYIWPKNSKTNNEHNAIK